MASSFSSQGTPAARLDHPLVLADRIKAPLNPPTWDEAMTPPFLTASLRRATAAVVPGAPQLSNPISSMIFATLSPMAGVGARAHHDVLATGCTSTATAARNTRWALRGARRCEEGGGVLELPGSCNGSCPFSLPIREKMIEAHTELMA